ncbi:hypothetical protein ED733_004575 [Metarhizium rileyi]|uniref:Gfo/Idh/MocA-like oxidoreductase N-terminal domain-containing protein n=1 Tax=Metarhizium rileyi (strain RCEF 4871) TaxID=1649241 RepID=A0A5C6G6R9_METRR|nr:hypothetical protein ED733_004575 [Metarhizium rileyi]
MNSISEPKNLLIIGIGPHTRKNHVPILLREIASGTIAKIVGVDIHESSQVLSRFISTLGSSAFPVIYIPSIDGSAESLTQSTCETLDSVVAQFSIDAVLIANHPSVHRVCTRWALERGLDVLLDKPISVRDNCSTNALQAAGIHDDFLQLAGLYESAKKQRDLLVSVHCQRRYNSAFMIMRQLISEVASQTGCPVTNIQSCHSDGQWRMPNEFIELPYHSYDRGHGKAAHSGYHILDLVHWFMEAGESEDKKVDMARVHVHATRPADVLAQLSIAEYEKLFPGFRGQCPYDEADVSSRTKQFGEVDAVVSIAFESAGRTMTLASVNLLHNGFSQRGSMTPNRQDLYKGNGRVRHETHVIHQGPFQAIYFSGLRTGGSNGSDQVEVRVFRNSTFNPSWDAHRLYDFSPLAPGSTQTRAQVQDQARERSIREFLDCLQGKKGRAQVISDLMSHKRTSTLVSCVYESLSQKWTGDSGTVEADFSLGGTGARMVQLSN